LPCCSGRKSPRDGKMDGKMNILNKNEIWFSALNKFSIAEPNKRAFNKSMWYFKHS
jgi:hypothetical protein